jgi:hypothetical protein
MLDPGAAATCHVSEPQPVGALGKNVRTFGYVPSLFDLEPGDLVLTSRCEPDAVSTFIRTYQAEDFDEAFSRWTHAAIYVEDGVIVEAVRKGVIVNKLLNYIPSHRLLVRRHSSLDQSDRMKIALQACLRIGQTYEMQAVRSFIDIYLSRGRPTLLPRRYRICSQIFIDALTYGPVKALSAVPFTGEATPAHLAACPDFTNVQLKWIKIARSP